MILMFYVLLYFTLYYFMLLSNPLSFSALVGDVNEDIEERIDYENLKAEPIRPIIH